MENWRKIDIYPNYEISDFGRVRHIKHLKIRKTRLNADGYEIVTIQNHDTKVFQTPRIHRLVAEAFLGATKEDVVDHINGQRNDNRLVNLRLTNAKGNMRNKGLINETVVEHIIQLYNQGLNAQQIAGRF